MLTNKTTLTLSRNEIPATLNFFLAPEEIEGFQSLPEERRFRTVHGGKIYKLRVFPNHAVRQDCVGILEIIEPGPSRQEVYGHAYRNVERWELA